MKELVITKGEWTFENYAGYFAIQDSAVINGNDILDVGSVGSFEAEHNAELCCDAGNTAQKCGLLPSELLKQRDELLAENQRLKAIIDNYNPCPGRPNPRDVNPYDSKAIKRTRNH